MENTLRTDLNVTNYTGIETVVTNWINSELDGYDNDLNELANDLQTIGLQGGLVSELIYYNQTTQFYKDYEQEIAQLFIDLYGVELNVYNLVENLGHSQFVDDMDERIVDLYLQARDDIKADYPDEWDEWDEQEQEQMITDYMDDMEIDLNDRDKNLLVWLAFEHVAYEIFQALGVE